LKSALNDSMTPDTWVPTSTVRVACSVPVATMRRLIEPVSTTAVVTCTWVVVWNVQAAAAPMTAVAATSVITLERTGRHRALTVP